MKRERLTKINHAWLLAIFLLFQLLLAACGDDNSGQTTVSQVGTRLTTSPNQPAVTSQSLSGTATPTLQSITGEEISVNRVIDGDTIEVLLGNNRYSVRIIGVDTPETVKPNTPVQCFGPEASAKTNELVASAGNKVVLEKDISETDQYGRLLRYVWLKLPSGLKMLNEVLVKEGYAQVATYPPDVKYQERFIAAQRLARETGAGLWSNCIGVATTKAAQPQVATTQPSTTGLTFVTVQGGSPGGTASVTVSTSAGASCTIVYVTPAGTQSQAQGLVPKTAGTDGKASWQWNIGTNTRPGQGHVNVTCGGVTVSSPITIG